MIRSGSFITTIGLMAAILFLYGCSKPPMVPENSRSLSPCGNLPNCVNSQSGRGLQSSKPVKANAEQWAMLKAWISMQKDWQIIIEDESYIQAVVSTPLMKFKDDIQLLYLVESNLIHVRSSSRLGLSDLGANANRVEKLRTLVTSENHQ
ncbi:MAG: DUF1499 domain-containing protein [Arenicellales bacterium]|jgi:uncharacterized protein (DUF1499 family)